MTTDKQVSIDDILNLIAVCSKHNYCWARVIIKNGVIHKADIQTSPTWD